MSTEPLTASPADDEIARDVPCLQCGYNLRGLTSFHTCPECGLTVARSLRGDRLCFADPRWVRRLARGAGWCAWGGIISTLAAFFRHDVLVGFSGSLALIGDMVALRGIWLLTTDPQPDPAVHTDRSFGRRLRLVGVLNIAISLAAIVFWWFSNIVLIVGTQGLSQLLNLAVTLMLCIWLRRLALRLPDRKLARRLAQVVWAVVLLTGGTILLALLILGIGAADLLRDTNPIFNIILVGPLVLIALAGLALAIYFIVLLFQLQGLLHDAARHAQRPA